MTSDVRGNGSVLSVSQGIPFKKLKTRRIWPTIFWEGPDLTKKNRTIFQTSRGPNFQGNTTGLLAAFSRWLAHPNLALGEVQLPLPVLQWSKWTERT